MKKLSYPFLILGIAACSATHAQAQPANQPKPNHPAASLHRWSMDLVAGTAIPVGQYAQYVFDNRNVGPVKTGGLLEISGTYHVNRSFGFTAVANGQINQIKDRPSDIVPHVLSNEPYVPTPFSNWWKIARVMAGATYTFSLDKSHKFDWIARIVGGLQKSKTAGFTAGYTGDPNDVTPYYATTLPWAFCYQGDIGFKWSPVGRLALIAYAGYNGSLSKYTVTFVEQAQVTQYTNPLGPPSIPVEHKFDLPTSSLLLRAGIAWDL